MDKIIRRRTNIANYLISSYRNAHPTGPNNSSHFRASALFVLAVRPIDRTTGGSARQQNYNPSAHKQNPSLPPTVHSMIAAAESSTSGGTSCCRPYEPRQERATTRRSILSAARPVSRRVLLYPRAQPRSRFALTTPKRQQSSCYQSKREGGASEQILCIQHPTSSRSRYR